MEKESLLIKESIEGDEEAFTQIVNLYKNYIFAIILNFIKDYGEAENVAQEVFLQIYASLSTYDNKNFKGWIGKIAANKSIDWIRKKKSRFREEAFDNTTDMIDSMVSDQNNNPEISLVDKERKEMLTKVISNIPEIYRNTIEKFYFQDKSYEQISKEEDVPIKTIASRLYRAKILLKEKWREENEAL
ncbi:RNA polymerase sigma factor (sigma-70 family) [Sedimentibacter acidaminivorans]|uniref:RNA polymerase sigma factor (Sigma-70 family) n=1 Tax=Sedimentibacter acidaminivorans TaxID=913099 RepID=A0ABS4GCG3_9FIRM|nr:sigma-70 family RNA polymerase sigma factor [Sedimentibacter acidaminivorans]MBP1925080.1 RNA polymerase sigma factor (sigma-70 family) [Sedimentibacter acidaminivorans]